MMGYPSTYNRGPQIYQAQRSRGLQHALMGKMGPWGTSFRVGYPSTYDYPMSLSQRLLSRGKAMQAFGIGDENRPWYEAFFEHMETIAPIAAQFVLNIMELRGEQRERYWQQANTQQREMAYLKMFESMAVQKSGGRGSMDPNTQAFLMQQLRSDPNRQQVYMTAAGGNATLAAQLQAQIEGSIGGFAGGWILWLAILGFSVVVVGGLVYIVASRR